MMVAPLFAALISFAIGAVAYLQFEEAGPKGRLLAALRGAAGTLLALLLLDLTCARSEASRRPLVLLDGSLSMQGAGALGTEAADSARKWGEIRYFGQDPNGPPAAPSFGGSALRPALLAASAMDRPVIIVTDGEIPDVRDLPADLLARASVRLFPRKAITDVAVLRVDAPDRITLGDTLGIEVELSRTSGAPSTATVELWSGASGRLMSRSVTLGPGGGHVSLELPSRTLGAGDHLLEVRVRANGDAEPRDDARDLLVRVTPLPGVVLLAAPPDWDARQLHATLRDVAELPVKGYARFGAAGWRSMEDARQVTTEEVARAARGADLLVLKGDPGEVARGAHPKGLWRWPSGEGGETAIEGDWYAGPSSTPSPLAGAWSGVATESLPPLPRVTPIEAAPGAWIGSVAQLGRRGVERPVIVGRDSAGIRTLLVAGDGFWRWAFHPGNGEEGYRQVVAAATNWLLGANDTTVGVARPLRRVVPLGHPIVFEWSGVGASHPVVVTFAGDSNSRSDTLLFDGTGRAEARLRAGRYGYQLQGGGRGVVAVERWSEEYVPKPPALRPQVATVSAGASRTVLRDQGWVYLLIVLLLAAEWWQRRRVGLR